MVREDSHKLLASCGSNLANQNPTQSIKRVIQWQKPYLNQAISPDQTLSDSCRKLSPLKTKGENMKLEQVLTAYQDPRANKFLLASLKEDSEKGESHRSSLSLSKRSTDSF